MLYFLYLSTAVLSSYDLQIQNRDSQLPTLLAHLPLNADQQDMDGLMRQQR